MTAQLVQKDTIQTRALYMRNFIFGVEDSLVSTVGLLSGVAAAGVPREQIFLTGVVLIFVEAFSMGVGSYLSEDFSDDYTQVKTHFKFRSVLAPAIMFFSYFISGFIPLFPYIIFDVETGFIVSIFISLSTLFALGAISAGKFRLNVLKHGIKMLLMGGIAIGIGYAVGSLL